MLARMLLFVPGTAGFFMPVAGLGEHQEPRRTVIALVLIGFTPLLLWTSSRSLRVH